MKKYKWGIIGPGRIATKFAHAISLAEGATLAAVASRDADRAKEFAKKFGAPTWYDNYEALANDPGIDVVYVATPHGFHCEHTLLCLKKGKAVLCEKPLALSNRQAQLMVDAAVANKTFLMEAMWTRFLPVMEKTLELIREGQIGEVKQVRADFGFMAPFNPDGRLYNLKLGGGALLDVGVYTIFLALQLLGEPDKIHSAAHFAPTGADETCMALFQYDDGRTAIISSTIGSQTALTAEISGTKGMIRIPAPWYKNDLLVIEQEGEAPRPISVDPMVNGFEYEIRETMECLDKGLIESPSMPHSFSLTMSNIMDTIRRQCGIRYPGE
jgi:predicted dehydrogenase